jgi:hypothetical protein
MSSTNEKTYANVEQDNPTDERPQVSEQQESQKDLSSISVENKIQHIVAHNANFGAFKINKKLNTLEYGFTKVGWFGVRSILNDLGLNSRSKRREFAENYLSNEE